jgi:hypothetical protein
MTRTRAMCLVLATLLSLSLGGADAVTAGMVELKNDSIVDFGQAIVVTGFVSDERAAAWLTSTCDGSLTAVRILWLSETGNTGTTLGQEIRVYDSGSFPDPGATLAQLVGPLMNDGAFNEFAITPPVAVTTGETIVVDFQFLDPPPQLVGPSVVADADGCQTGKNAIFAIPPSGWIDACFLGVSGDFAIRAVVDCGPIPIFADGFESGDTSAWSVVVP